MPSWWLPYVRDFVNRAAALYGEVGFTVTSFGRTRAHNAAVGGVSDSQHLLWTAADIVPQGGMDMDSLYHAAQDSGLFGYVLNEGNHVHVQLFEGGSIPPWVFEAVAV